MAALLSRIEHSLSEIGRFPNGGVGFPRIRRLSAQASSCAALAQILQSTAHRSSASGAASLDRRGVAMLTDARKDDGGGRVQETAAGRDGSCPVHAGLADEMRTPAGRKVMVLTGASRGIGHATVRLFSEAGWRVITCSRRPFDGSRCPWDDGEADHVQVDLGDRHAVRRAVAEIKARLAGAPLHALVNNAGISPKDADGHRLTSLTTPVETWIEDMPQLLHIQSQNFFLTYPQLVSKAMQNFVRVDGTPKRDKEKLTFKSFTSARSWAGLFGDAFRLARAWR
jgi:hypothetical protein